jgi:hypothetical protein
MDFVISLGIDDLVAVQPDRDAVARSAEPTDAFLPSIDGDDRPTFP